MCYLLMGYLLMGYLLIGYLLIGCFLTLKQMMNFLLILTALFSRVSGVDKLLVSHKLGAATFRHIHMAKAFSDSRQFQSYFIRS